ncbi:MAG: ferritin-like domain-containing protein [Streptosporangiales bacterium]
MRADLRRRSVLAAGAAAAPLLAAGCKGVGALGTPPRPSREVGVLREAISAEKVMIARYRSAVAASPALAGTLTPLLGQHQAHLAALRARLIVPAGAPATPVPATAEASGPQPSGAGAPAAPATALAALAAAEDAAATMLTGLLPAVSPSLAQLLASVAASEASHAVVLHTRRASR